MTGVESHRPGCTCEVCWAQLTTDHQVASGAVSVTRAELLAALDRAFNAGVQAERERAARERAERHNPKS